MSRKKTVRRKLARNIYFDVTRNKHLVRYTNEAHKRKDLWYEADVELHELKRIRDAKEKSVDAYVDAGEKAEGSFIANGRAFLKTRENIPSYPSERSHLQSWFPVFRGLSSFEITHDAIQKQCNDWRFTFAPRTVRHRLGILRMFFSKLAPGRPNPCDDVTTKKPDDAVAYIVPKGLVVAVAESLRQGELRGTLRDSKARARFLVCASTGIRPTQVRDTKPHMMQLDRGIWLVPPGKKDKGTVCRLTGEMMQAWQLFIAADAWGDWNRDGWRDTLHRHGWPKGREVGPYKLRHSIGNELNEEGVPAEDIQHMYGHRQLSTTKGHYVPNGSTKRQKALQEVLEGRLGLDAAPATFDTTPVVRKSHKGRRAAAARAAATTVAADTKKHA